MSSLKLTGVGAENTWVITPLDMTPDQLVAQLYAQGKTLMALGDRDHGEYAIQRVFNGLLDSPRSRPTIFFAERDRDNQWLYDDYASPKAFATDVQRFDRYITDPDDYYAPSKKYPEKRQQYFDTKRSLFATTKQHGTQVSFIDVQLSGDHSIDIKNAATVVRTNYNLISNFYTSDGTYRNIAFLSDVELQNVLQRLPYSQRENNFFATQNDIIYTRSVALGKGETMADKRMQMAAAAHGLFKTLGVDAHTPLAELRAKSREHLAMLEKKIEIAENKRDAVRDQYMFKGIQQGVAQASEQPQRFLLWAGAAHLDARDEASDHPAKNLMEHLRADPAIRPVRIEVVPVSKGTLDLIAGEKKQRFGGTDCAVTIGGRSGADYTFFVVGEVGSYIITTSQAISTPPLHAAIEANFSAPAVPETPGPATLLASLQWDEKQSIKTVLRHRAEFDADRDGQLDETFRQTIAGNPDLVRRIDEALQAPSPQADAAALPIPATKAAPSLKR